MVLERGYIVVHERTMKFGCRGEHYDMIKFCVPEAIGKKLGGIYAGVVYSDGYFGLTNNVNCAAYDENIKCDVSSNECNLLENIFVLLNSNATAQYKEFILSIVVALRLRKVRKNVDITLSSLFNPHQLAMIPQFWKNCIMKSILPELASDKAKLFNGLHISADPAKKTNGKDPEKIVWKHTRNQKSWD